MLKFAFTMSNNLANMGYTSTVQNIATNYDRTYTTKDRHCNLEEEKYNENINRIANKIVSIIKDNKGESVNIFCAGGKDWKKSIGLLQIELLKILDEKSSELNKILIQRIEFTLVTERFNETDTFANLQKPFSLIIVTQDDISPNLQATIPDKIKIFNYKVDCCAISNPLLIEEEAQHFFQKNQKILQESGVLEAMENSDLYFYLGGRGDGFSEENSINITEEYKKFAEMAIKESFSSEEIKKPIIIFTHGIRSFTTLECKNNFKPIEEMYEYLQNNLEEEREVFIFSQKKNGDSRTPVLIKILKNKNIEEIPIEKGGSCYNFSLYKAREKDITIIATTEQQNIPADCLAMSIKASNIKNYNWELQTEKHKEIYEKIKNKSFSSSLDVIMSNSKDIKFQL